MAEGDQRLAVAETFVRGDVPLRGNRRQDAQGLRRVRPSHMRQVTEGTAMGEVFVGVMGRKCYCLERERRRDEQQNRKPPYAGAVKCHRRMNYTSVSAAGSPRA